MRRALLWFLWVAIGIAGCATGGAPPPQTQLEIREYQTRIVDSPDAKLVMKAVLNVLQDEGYIVKEANSELGVITATHEGDIKGKRITLKSLLAAMGSNGPPAYDKTSIVEVTANISAHAAQTRVRANFMLKTLNNLGAVSSVRSIGDEPYYQEFFAKVDKAVFIEKEKL